MTQIIYINSFEDNFDIATNVFAIGNFDGIHLGHQHILNKAKQLAGGNFGVITFNPHPAIILQNKSNYFLSSLQLKYKLFEKFGASVIIVIDFNLIKDLAPQEFFEKILFNKLNIGHLISGNNFCFGKNKEGNKELLYQLAKQFDIQYEAVDLLLNADGIAYSSSNIRNFLKQGDIKSANTMLNRAFEVEAIVIKGAQIARQLGFPTANMIIDDFAQAKFGVYVVEIELEGVAYYGVANFGVKPTFAGENRNLLEVHIFNFNEDIYGKFLKVRLLEFLRAEKKFNNIDELKLQIKIDVQNAISFLKID